jgi:hypothetical protein
LQRSPSVFSKINPQSSFVDFAKKPLCFSKINPLSSFADFAKKPLYFSKINPQSMIFQLSLKLEKYLQKGPYPQKNPQK